jgi:hypothetical protein
MNERIKQLAEKASKDNEHGYPVTLEYTNRFAQKLAELIIEECCNILRDNVEVALNASGSPVYSEGLIRENFGVKE